MLDVCWTPGAKEIVSVSGDRRVAVMAVKDDGSLPIIHFLYGHTRSIKSVSVNRSDPCELIFCQVLKQPWSLSICIISFVSHYSNIVKLCNGEQFNPHT